MAGPVQLSDRIQSLEMLVMHLQHDIEQLNSVILSQHGEIRALRALIERFESQLASALTDPEVRDIEQERPPHY